MKTSIAFVFVLMLVCLCIASPRNQAINFGQNNPPITSRPIQNEPAKRPLYRVKERPACSGLDETQTFCDEDDEYPSELFDNILRQTGFQDNLGEEEKNVIFENNLALRTPFIKDPNPSFISEEPSCLAVERLLEPKRGKTASDDWAFILQTQKLRQAIRVEQCLKPNGECIIQSHLPAFVTATCRQKYVYRKLLVADPSGSHLQPESMLFPSSCVCYIRGLDNSFEILGRNSSVESSRNREP